MGVGWTVIKLSSCQPGKQVPFLANFAEALGIITDSCYPMRDNPGIPEHTKCLRPEGAIITEHVMLLKHLTINLGLDEIPTEYNFV